MNNHQLGNWGEKQAVLYLEEKGYEIIEKNFRLQLGEIDIIATRQQYLVFLEVKTRRSTQYGPPQSAVNYHKRNRIRKIARIFLSRNDVYANYQIRFDVLAVKIKQGASYRINHIVNAF
ncbi:MAG: YraN family protein [Bacillota bacterium]